MSVSIRRIALAGFAGITIAIVVDGLLQLALEAVRTDARRLMFSEVGGRMLERSVWAAAAMLLWLAAPAVASWLEGEWWGSRSGSRMTFAAAVRTVGTSMIVVPLLWLVATWIVLLVRTTIDSSWETVGRAFVSSSYYSAIVTANAPWLLAGAALVAWSRHLPLQE